MECEIPGCDCEARLLSLEIDGQMVVYQLCERHIDEFLDLRAGSRTPPPEQTPPPAQHQSEYLRWLKESRTPPPVVIR